MNINPREVAAWLELTRIARMEIILDKVEKIIVHLDLERSDPLYLYWERLSQENGEQLGHWIDLYKEGIDVDEWLEDMAHRRDKDQE